MIGHRNTNVLTIAMVAMGIVGLTAAPAHAEFITPDAAVATSRYYHERNLINVNDLSTNTAAGTHSGGGWMSANATVADQEVIIDLRNTYNLTQAYVWQYTENTDRNTRTMDIYVSADNVSYTPVGSTVTLKTTAADNEPAEVVPLSASNVRYVKFDVLTNGGADTTGFVGLGEVRFEGELLAAGPTWITPSNVTATSEYSNGPADHLIDGSGLSDNNQWGLHGDDTRDYMWLSASGVIIPDQELVFDLGESHELSEAHVWQGTEVLSWNTETMDIYVSDSDTGPWTQVGSTVTLTQSDADDQPADVFSMSGASGRYVKFDILTAGSGSASGFVALGEVRFTAIVVPDPPPGMVLIIK